MTELDPPSPAPRQTADETVKRLRERAEQLLVQHAADGWDTSGADEAAGLLANLLSALPTPREDR